MKNVLVLGATGGIGNWVVKLLADIADIKQTVYVRTPAKLNLELAQRVEVLQGDVLDTDRLREAMKDKDIVVAALSGDWYGQAKSIVEAMPEKPLSHIFWVTGLGIHHEVPGKTGEILEYYVNRFPEYIKAADVIENSGVPCTLVRAANLTNGSNMDYHIQQEGQPLHAETVDRCAVAKCITDRINGAANLKENASIGVTN